MRLFVRVVQLLVIFLFFCNWISGATVKTKDGRTISGEIQGMVVLKGEERESDRRGRSISYVIAQGKDIASIDEQGLNTVPDALVRVLVCWYSAADGPDAALCPGQAILWFDVVSGINRTAQVGSGKTDVVMRAVKDKNLTDTLIGELTTVNKRPVVLPALTIATAEGPIKLPVEAVVKPTHSATSENVAPKGALPGAVPAAKGAKPEEPSAGAAAKFEEAKKHFAQAVELSKQKLYPQAEQEIRAALQLEPDHAQLHFALGTVLDKQNKFDLAAAEYRTAIRIRPNLVDAYNNLGIALCNQGDLDGAIAQYHTAIRLKPDQASFHHNLGAALDEKGDMDGAIAEFHTALRLQPNSAMTYEGLGTSLEKKGDLEGAMEEYRTALRLQPDWASAHVGLGVALAKKGDLDGAIAEYRTAIRLQPNLATAHHNLGNMLAAKGDLDGAIEEYRTALRLQPDYADAHVNLGAALAKKGDLDGAIAEYRTAIRVQPGHAPAHNNLGVALEKKGDLQAALEELHTANLLDPKNPTISQQYERLLRLMPLSQARGAAQSRGTKPAETIAAGPHHPAITALEIVSTNSSGAEVDVKISVYDEAGDLGPEPTVNWMLKCGGGGIFGATHLSNFPGTGQKNSVIETSLSQVGEHAFGLCDLAVSVKDTNGNESAELRRQVEFK